VRRDRGPANIPANDEYATVLSLRRNSLVRPHKGDINFAKTARGQSGLERWRDKKPVGQDIVG